jgi:hypothetical protein
VTIFQVIIGPLVVLGVLAAAIFALALWVARRWVQVLTARRDRERSFNRINTTEYAATVKLTAVQADAIDAVITEMTEHPSIVLSAGTRDQLFAAHEAAGTVATGRESI